MLLDLCVIGFLIAPTVPPVEIGVKSLIFAECCRGKQKNPDMQMRTNRCSIRCPLGHLFVPVGLCLHNIVHVVDTSISSCSDCNCSKASDSGAIPHVGLAVSKIIALHLRMDTIHGKPESGSAR